MEKTQRNLMLCGMVFAIALVVSNMVAAKTIATGFTLFGTAVVVPSAVICYFITFLMTDVVGEIWGRKEAQLIVSHEPELGRLRLSQDSRVLPEPWQEQRVALGVE